MQKQQFFFGIIALFLFLANPVYGQNFKKTDSGIKTNVQSMDVEIQFFTPSIVRVVKSPENKPFAKESVSVIKSPEKVNPEITQTGDNVRMKSNALIVEFNLKTGKVSYFDLTGANLFTEKDYGTEFTDIDDGGKASFSLRQSFLLDKDEAIYGLGQQQEGKMNQRNQVLSMLQENTKVAIPFIQSTKGYGLFWDNYSTTTFSDNKQGMSFTSNIADCLDYYFMYGKDMDGVVARMRELTGEVPLFPLWTWGYWQSRERYVSQNELVGTVQRYRDLKVPLDGIIQDWQYWSTDNDYWNGMSFGNPEFPQPKKMVDDIHKLNAHTIISIWPSFGHKTEPFKEFKEKNLLLDYSTFPSDETRSHNPYKKEARDIYWKHMNDNLFSIGIDGWWMDATEVEMATEKGDGGYQETGMGSYQKVRNAFPLLTVEGVYDNQRKVTSDKRVFILTRSAFAGQQRAGANTWSGDIDADWETLEKQISAGLNFSACAIPYWNSDIGGFWVRDGGQSSHEDYRELYVRWLQFGAFSPMMRSHGTNTPREIWQFGEKGYWAYDAIEKFIHLRYALLPYNYSLSWDVTANAGSVMRMLAMDFPQDNKVHDMGTQYMYGKSFLVAPVLTQFYTSGVREKSVSNFSKTQIYPVYLPKGSEWFDFWTGEKFSGGTTVQRETPIDLMPLYVKAGSIVPIGPNVQYAHEKDWSNLEIRIYDGADAEFTLYEDEKDNYNYEKGMYSTIKFNWDNASRKLTIEDREGEFPGMLKNRKFQVVLVKDGNASGEKKAKKYDKTISYKGKRIELKIKN